MNFLDLNEYCLLKIIKSLDISAQITLTQVCSQLQKIIHNLWQHSYKILTLDGFLTNLYKNDAQFLTVLTYLKNFIIEFKIQHLKAQKLRLLGNIKFDNCLQLTLSDWHDDLSDVDIELISKIFPRLQIFLLKCTHINGAYISNCKNLNRLDLSHCPALRSEYLPIIFHELKLKLFKMRFNCYDHQQILQNPQYEQHICSILRCPTLQELELDDYQLAMLTANMQLKQLRHLTNVKCYVRHFMAYILYDLENYYALDIVEFIAFEDNVTLQLLLSISRDVFANLIKLTIISSYLMDLPNVLAKSLLELHLVRCNLDQAILLNCVSRFKHLRVLNVTKSKGLKEQFLWELLIMLRQNFADRNFLPLKIIIRDSCLEKTLLYHPDIIRNADILELSWELLLLDVETNHFEFTLNQRNSSG